MKLAITFFLDGKLYASRFWDHAPRAGDFVALNGIAFEVSKVVWIEWDKGTERPDTPIDIYLSQSEETTHEQE